MGHHLKTIVIVVASLMLTVLLGLAGCGEDEHRDRFHGDRDRDTVRYERQDNDRHEDRRESRHEDRDKDAGHEGEHGDR
jgi:Ni/Co efflux regulator RcnB